MLNNFSPLHMFLNSHKQCLDHLATKIGPCGHIATSPPTKGYTWVKGPELYTIICCPTFFVNFLLAHGHQHNLPHNTFSTNRVSGQTALVPTFQKPFLNFVWCFPTKKKRGRRHSPSLGKALRLFLKRCQCPKLPQQTWLQCLPISFTGKSVLSRRNSTIAWHCSWIHETF